jgi:hypothetical protein
MSFSIGSSVRVSYDFEGEDSNEELSVKEGEVLTVRSNGSKTRL